MIGMLVGKGLCRFRVHSMEVWEYRQDGDCAQDGACRWCGAPREQFKHEYPRRGGKVARTTCSRCNQRAARREGVTDLFLGDPTEAAETAVGLESDWWKRDGTP